jgi:hypothetical protein
VKELCLPGLKWNEKLALLTYRFKPVEDTSTPVTHIFEPGMYIREMFIPEGTVFIGRAHRYGHKCELVSGSVRLILESGDIEMDAPHELETSPGFHMVLVALTDVVGRTYHPNPTESRDKGALEAGIFHPIEEMLALGAEVAQQCKLLEEVA